MIDQLAIESTSLSSVERSELDEYELIIASGERVFVTVGNALIVIRDKRLYRENHGTFEQYLSNKWPNISRRRAYQLMDAAVVAEDVKHVSHPLNERQALELLGVAPEERPTMLRRAIETAPNGKVTAAHIDQVIKEKAFPYACETCNERFSVPVWHCPGCAHHYHEQDSECGNCHEYTSDGKRISIAPEEDELDPPMELEQVADQFPHELTPTDKALLNISVPAAPRVNAGLFTSATPEWYTPKHIVDRVIRVFDGFISLDPCSNSGDFETANVPALDYWTQAEDGLAQPWHGNVYMNPPYGDVIGDWVKRMCDAFESEEIDAAIALLPGRIDTAWFQLLNRYPICCVRGRLRFSGSENSAPFPSVVVYLGYNPDAFITQFRDIGPIRPAAMEVA